MRVKTNYAKRVATALAFSLIIPFSGIANALPRKPPQAAPASFPSSMKLKEPKLGEDDLSIVASLRGGTGSMIKAMLSKKNYKRLARLHNSLNRPTDRELVRNAASNLARESRILGEALEFDRESRLDVAIASIFMNSRQLFLARNSDKKAVESYMKGIESLGLPRMAFAVRQWLKKGKGEVVPLLRGMEACLDRQKSGVVHGK